jgi:hypothetical protein
VRGPRPTARDRPDHPRGRHPELRPSGGPHPLACARRRQGRRASAEAATTCPRGYRQPRFAAGVPCASRGASWFIGWVAIPTRVLIAGAECRALGSLPLDLVPTLRLFKRPTPLAPALQRLRSEVHKAPSVGGVHLPVNASDPPLSSWRRTYNELAAAQAVRQTL